METSKRLNKITVMVNGVIAREYDLIYEVSPASGRSLLSRVEMEPLPPVVLEWSNAFDSDYPLELPKYTSLIPPDENG